MRHHESSKWITKEILGSSLKSAFCKLNPKVMMKNPVMFVVEIGFFICLTLTFVPSLFHDEGTNLSLMNGIVALILFITVLFANFAEAVAEGRGKAQAETLKKTKKDTQARRIQADGSEQWISAAQLNKGDVVLVKAGELIVRLKEN